MTSKETLLKIHAMLQKNVTLIDVDSVYIGEATDYTKLPVASLLCLGVDNSTIDEIENMRLYRFTLSVIIDYEKTSAKDSEIATLEIIDEITEIIDKNRTLDETALDIEPVKSTIRTAELKGGVVRVVDFQIVVKKIENLTL